MKAQWMTSEEGLWLEGLAGRILEKLGRTSRRIKDSFPFVSIGGQYRDYEGPEETINWWTNSFWPGLLWLGYRETGDEFLRSTAESCEARLDAALMAYDGLHHDVGFMWSLTGVADFKLTGSERSRQRAMLAASVLASRFNIKGSYIRAWNGDNAGLAIVDCLMNLPLLYWASRQSGDERFASVARAHADTAMRAVQRPDGSVNHIVSFDPATGELIEALGGQGFAAASSWSRGQAWALYGFALSHRYTGEARYLDAAKRVAHYFIANVHEDWVPAIDFRAPSSPAAKDSSAGAIAAAGLLELAEASGEFERPMFGKAAVRILKALDRSCGAWGQEEEGLLLHGSHSYHQGGSSHPNDTPLIYGDYFFAEAVLRLRGSGELFW